MSEGQGFAPLGTPVSREDLLLKGGHVLTMDPGIGDLPKGDVLILDGEIAQVAPGIDRSDIRVIDATGMVVQPGFVETHWHMWNSLWRGLAHEAAGYFGLHRLAMAYTAEDHYLAVGYAAAEAIAAGVTTCHNWSNALRGPEDAVCQAQALADVGIRARFGYGHLTGMGLGPVDQTVLQNMAACLSDISVDGLIDLGIVCHDANHLRTEVEAARALGLRTIAPHADLSGAIDLLGPEFIFTHGPGTPDAFLQLLAAKRVKIGLCPATDPLIGAGLPPIMRFLAAGTPFEDIGFSVDVTCQAAADPFAAMRTIMYAARIAQKNGASFQEIIFTPADPADPANGLMTPRQLLQLATINGARVLGLEERIGSLTPGKRADVILIRTDDGNMLPDPDVNIAFQLVQHAQPANVDTVIVDGRILKSAGRLTGMDHRALARRAAKAQASLRHRGAMPLPDMTI
ncbi:amidohydrolase family protein [Novosphingobium humi]|uniref:Amidohydrolase family protein n=1 Tax=Novosphingobium humi TaxID=2282397 RepID=A0ABY7U3N9_9SPHN|nr:amidohydrolase family protein [Novosphingobium humi]WCT79225.1 amidohydrolase family protein [Novosphingobium humi]